MHGQKNNEIGKNDWLWRVFEYGQAKNKEELNWYYLFDILRAPQENVFNREMDHEIHSTDILK